MKIRICKTCGASEDEVEFYRNRNRCRYCALSILSEYNRRRNRDPDYIEKRRERWRKWRKTHKVRRDPDMESRSKQSSVRRFLTDQMAHLRRISRKKGIAFDLDLDYLEDLWRSQNGRCAISKISMEHKRNDLAGVRIDAIEGEKGFLKSNTQLVCDGIKRMKRDMNNDEVKRFVEEIRSVIVI